MRLITAAILCMMPAAGQTLVSESHITGRLGQPASGYLRIWPNTGFESVNGVRVETVQQRVPVVNGAFSVALWPNDTSTPSGTYYLVRWQLDGAAPRLEFWYVPTSGSPLNVQEVEACVSIVGGVATIGACGGKTWAQMSSAWSVTTGTWAQQ